jgi:hypothetical protein
MGIAIACSYGLLVIANDCRIGRGGIGADDVITGRSIAIGVVIDGRTGSGRGLTDGRDGA